MVGRVAKVFTGDNLLNIDYDATRALNNGFFLNTRDLYGEFKFVLKDGRTLCCKQDLNKIFIVHNSNNYGVTLECDLWGKMAAATINDDDKFFAMVKSIENAARNLAGRLDGVNVEEIVKHRLADFVNDYYNVESMFIKLIKMGLDCNNDFVTIELVDE